MAWDYDERVPAGSQMRGGDSTVMVVEIGERGVLAVCWGRGFPGGSRGR